MAATTRFDTQIIGVLPVITNYLDRLNMANIIDDIVPYEGDVPCCEFPRARSIPSRLATLDRAKAASPCWMQRSSLRRASCVRSPLCRRPVGLSLPNSPS